MNLGGFLKEFNMNINSPILITGCARSGTSFTAGIFHICGAWGGKFVSAGFNNQKGFFENAAIRNKICKPFLESIGADPKGQYPLPEINIIKDYVVNSQFADIWRYKILGVLNEQKYNPNNSPWFYKGAKMCLMWPIWNAAFPDAKWIIVRRDKEDIISSCLKTGFMSAYKDKQGWEGWVDYHLTRFEEIKKSCKNVYEVYPQEMIEGNFTNIKKIIECFNLIWKEKEVIEFITPALWSEVIRKGESSNGKSHRS